MSGNHLFDGLLGGRQKDSRILLRVPDGDDWSYAELVDLSGRLAKSVQAIALYLATVRAGAVFLPLNTAYTRAEVEYFLEDAEPALFVCASDRESEFDGIESRVLTLDGDGSLMAAAENMAPGFTNVARASDDLAACRKAQC
jgi:malonyl-CoA/methylmalonyl-CoA synthetase